MTVIVDRNYELASISPRALLSNIRPTATVDFRLPEMSGEIEVCLNC